MNIPEEDWKRLRGLKPLALERLCESILRECQSMIASGGATSHERYLAVYRHIHDRDRDIERAFHGISRSKALDRLASMCALKLISDVEFAAFSPETQRKVGLRLGFSQESD